MPTGDSTYICLGYDMKVVLLSRGRQGAIVTVIECAQMVGWLWFDVHFQHKYGYIRDEDVCHIQLLSKDMSLSEGKGRSSCSCMSYRVCLIVAIFPCSWQTAAWPVSGTCFYFDRLEWDEVFVTSKLLRCRFAVKVTIRFVFIYRCCKIWAKLIKQVMLHLNSMCWTLMTSRYFVVYLVSLWHTFSALTLLTGHQEEHPAYKNWVTWCWLAWLSVCSEMKMILQYN